MSVLAEIIRALHGEKSGAVSYTSTPSVIGSARPMQNIARRAKGSVGGGRFAPKNHTDTPLTAKTNPSPIRPTSKVAPAAPVPVAKAAKVAPEPTAAPEEPAVAKTVPVAQRVAQKVANAKAVIPEPSPWSGGPMTHVGPQELSGRAIIEQALQGPPIKRNSRSVVDVAKDLNSRAGMILRRDLGVDKITESSPKTDDYLANGIAHDLEQSLNRSGSSATWYSDKMKQAMGVIQQHHPEVQTDPNKKFAYLTAMAIGSQGETPDSNVRIAEKAYGYYQKNGKFPENMEVADPSINANFRKVNHMIEQNGVDNTRTFFNKEFTVRDLEKETGVKYAKTLKDAKVYGSAVLGPKIGQGFYQNLNGNFKPITMDMWFMRSWGRMTNTGIGDTDIGPVQDRFKRALADKGMPVPDDPHDLYTQAKSIQQQHEHDFKNYRADYDSGARKKEEHVYSAINLVQHSDGKLNDTPSGGRQRQWMTDVFNKAIGKLADKGIHIDPAEAQATWWTPEKDLYARLGAKGKEVHTDYYKSLSKYFAGQQQAPDAGTPAKEAQEKFVHSFYPWVEDPDEPDRMSDAGMVTLARGMLPLLRRYTDKV